MGRTEAARQFCEAPARFAELDEDFFANSVIVPGKAGRLIAVGRSASGDILVVFAMLGSEAISVVSMRYASRKERRLIDD